MPYAQADAAEIYYETHGEGSPLVLAHGAGGNTLVWWQQIPNFSRQHRVIVFDHRCFGRSRCDKSDFAPRHFANDLIAVLDDAGVDRAAVVGMSMGGWTALPAAVRFPERVEKLVLCGTPGGLITDSVLQAMITIARDANEQGEESLRGSVTFSDRFQRERPEMVHLYNEISALNVNFDPQMMGAMATAEARVELSELDAYNIPTLMIAAEHDRLFPSEVLSEVAALIPGCELADFPGAGHSMYYEDPELYERIVLDFLRR